MNPCIQNAVQEFLKKRDDIFGKGSTFENFEYNFVDMPAAAGGFQSDTAFGCIRYRNANDDIFSSPPLLIKYTQPDRINCETVLVQFVNEIFFYGHVLPFLAHYESSAATLFPEFYGSSTQTYPESTEAVIIMENLCQTGYKTAPSKSFLDYPHLSLMARSIGKFHAYSYLARQNPTKFSAHAAVLNPIHPVIVGTLPGILGAAGIRGLTRLSQHGEYTNFVPVIRHLLDGADQYIVKLFKKERYNPWAVICHGDYSSGNVMFKYEGDHPIDMKMIDLAMSTYSTPVLDLALLLYIHADQKTRDIHWERLMDDYFVGLSSLSVKVDCLPTKDDILDEFRKNAFYAYLIASIWLPNLIGEDFGLGNYRQILREEYAHHKHPSELPHEIKQEIFLKMGGEIGTMALTDILKDMLKRGFIKCSSILSKES